MDSVSEACRSLSAGQSGHWGIVIDRSTAPLADDVLSMQLKQGGCGVTCNFRCAENAQITQTDLKETFPVRDLEQRLDSLLRSFMQNHRGIVRCIFNDFERLSVDDQCSILRITRAIREKIDDARLQTIVIGAWNLFRIQEHWRDCYHEASPVPDRRHVFFEGRRNADDVRSRLRAAELISSSSSEYENTCAEMLLESTGGDEFLVRYVLDCLTSQRQRLDAIESAAAQTMDSGEVAEELARRCVCLSTRAWSLLAIILNNQFVSVRANDIDGEDLRLAGFVDVQRTGSNDVCLSVRSVIVDAVLRQNWRLWAVHQSPVYDGRDLARPNIALNAAGYILVCKIETTLRNLIVLSLSSGLSWTERVTPIKAAAHDSESIENELLGLARESQNVAGALRDDMAAGESTKNVVPSGANIAEDNNRKKPKQISLIDSAKNWRLRHHQNTMLDLAGDSLIYFITTEGLHSILINKKQGIYVAISRFFPNKDELKTFLEHYIAIRAAVAHNQPITLRTLKRLGDMREDLEKRLYRSQPSINELQARSGDTGQ